MNIYKDATSFLISCIRSCERLGNHSYKRGGDVGEGKSTETYVTVLRKKLVSLIYILQHYLAVDRVVGETSWVRKL